MPRDRDDLLAACRTMPRLARLIGAGSQVARLPSRSNDCLRVETEAGAFAVRLPALVRTGRVHSPAEASALALAGALGIGPEVALHDAATGLLVTRLVGDGTALSPRDLAGDERLVRRIGEAVGRLHRSTARLPLGTDAPAVAQAYLARLATADLAWPADHLAPALGALAAALAADPSPAMPSHGDLTPGNIVVGEGGRVVLVDWEYAAMIDPAFDLAYLAVEGELAPAAEAALLAGYGRPVLASRVASMKLAAAVVSAGWAEIEIRERGVSGLADHAAARWALARSLARA